MAISGGGNCGTAGYQPAAIATTAYLRSAEEADAHVVLTKPFEVEESLQTIETLLGRRPRVSGEGTRVALAEAECC